MPVTRGDAGVRDGRGPPAEAPTPASLGRRLRLRTIDHRFFKLSPRNAVPTSSITTAGSRCDTLVELLALQARQHRDEVAFRFHAEDGSQATLTFGELEQRARAIGNRLSIELKPGDRALLVYPPGLEFIAAFFGCLYAGVVATPATYPKPRRPLPRMSRIAEDSGALVALTTSQTLETIDLEQQDAAAQALSWLATDVLTEPSAGWEPHPAVSGDLAFLQYTSGSTSEPKGVMVTHGNLLANLEAIRVAFGLPATPSPVDPDGGGSNCGVFWLPAYHDMGLIGGVLTPLYVGGPSVLMPPTAFLKRPLRWLETIDKYDATISGAPDFAYRLCVERTTAADRERLDLGSWRLAFCGAEPIHASTLTGFADAFEPAGFRSTSFYPCYGLAEATLLAAGPESDQPPTLLAVDRTELGAGRAVPATGDRPSQELVGCGCAPAGHRVLIVDPETLRPRDARRVGEIVVAGPSVAQGYWRRDAESSAVFGCEIDSPDAADAADSHDAACAYMRTGDLGFLYEGELFVTGRLKDVIIVRGRNYYPQDLEQTAEAAHADVMAGAAFACEVQGEERLVVVHQVARTCRQESWAGVVDDVRRAILADHEVDPHAVVLIRQSSLPVTSSGKVQRSLCRERYLAGELKTLHEWNSEAARKAADHPPAPPAPELEGLSVDAAVERIEEWMLAWLVGRVHLDAVDADRNRPFAELGLDSLTAVELSGELEDAFDVPLPPIVAWNYPTPAALARYLAEQSLPAAVEPIEASNGHAAGHAADVESLLADIENLSDEEAQRLLAGD
ncbi:MAG: AMP-binding protein [Planctomycetota bacterium]